MSSDGSNPSSPRSEFSPNKFHGEGLLSSSRKPQSKKKLFTFRRCLVANDSTFLLGLMVKLLEKEFDEVVKVTDGLQAVNKVLSQPPNYFNMIILDINMPL